MLSPQKKKAYIILVVVCVIASAGILWWGNSSSTVPANDLLDTEIPVTTDGATAANSGMPAVFPQSVKLDAAVFDSGEFRKLQPYKEAALDGSERGRQDPYQSY